MLDTDADLIARDDRLPWPLSAAGVVACLALFLTGGRSFVLPVLTIAIIGAHFTRRRFPRSTILAWTMRVLLFGIIVFMAGVPRGDVGSAYFEPAYTNVAGYVFAGELALRAWMRREPGRVRESRGVAVLAAVLIMTAATNTYERRHIQILAPLFVLLLILTLRSFESIGQPDREMPAKRQRGLVLLRALALALALLAGMAGVVSVTKYDIQITSLAMRLLPQRPSRRTEIGLSVTPRLRGVFVSNTPARRVLLLHGPVGERHLRMLAFDEYFRGRWGPLLGTRTFGLLPASPMVTPANPKMLRVTRLAGSFSLLPAPLDISSFNCDVPVERDEYGDLRTSDSTVSPPFEVVLPAHPDSQGPLCLPPGPEQRERLLEVPWSVDPRVVLLAQRVAGKGDPLTRVRRIEKYLRTTNAYSLSFQSDGEPLNDFILNKRAAHCQFFGSAVVMMARAVDVPARFVAGYYAHEAYSHDEMVVRDRDAHAWAECWIDGTGWITVDATPEGATPAGRFPEPDRAEQWRERLEDLPGKLREWFVSADKMVLARLLAIPAAAGVVIWLMRQVFERRRKRPSAQAYAMSLPELQRIGRRFERWLGRRGVRADPARTWRDALAEPRAGTAAEVALPQAAAFLDAYDLARFGGADAAALDKLQQMLDSLEGAHSA